MNSILQDIKTARRQYLKITGRKPQIIRMKQDTLDKIKEEMRAAGTLKYTKDEKSLSHLFGMTVEIHERFPPDRLCELLDEETMQG